MVNIEYFMIIQLSVECTAGRILHYFFLTAHIPPTKPSGKMPLFSLNAALTKPQQFPQVVFSVQINSAGLGGTGMPGHLQKTPVGSFESCVRLLLPFEPDPEYPLPFDEYAAS